MQRILAIKNTDHLCWNCLKEKENIHQINFMSMDYGSKFDGEGAVLQLCDECYHDNPKLWQGEVECLDKENDLWRYLYEDEIFAYFHAMPMEGQQFVFNEFAKNCQCQMDPQDWLDYYANKCLPYEKAKDYGLWALEEIQAYRDRFPKCKWVINRIFSDQSKGSYCPFGSHGCYNQKIREFDYSDKCYRCRYFQERTKPIVDIKDEDYEIAKDILMERAIQEAPEDPALKEAWEKEQRKRFKIEEVLFG